MTDEQENNEVVKELCFKMFNCYLADSMEAKLLTVALAARERAVWLEAAKLAEIYADCMEEDLPHSERIQRLTQQITAQTIAKRCRQQVEEVKPIPAPEEEI